MRDFIKKRIREQFIDDQDMNNGTELLCNKMSVSTYEEGIKLITNAIGTKEENPNIWKRIEKPLKMWLDATIQIRKELKTGMTGDSEVDESNTWWSAIQSTICEQGRNFQ